MYLTIKFLPIKSMFCIIAMLLTLTGCGGGGGGAPAAAPVSGKLVADVRSATSHRPEYDTNPSFKEYVDENLTLMGAFIKEIESFLKWESDIPVVFSGCGKENAFFGAPISDVHNFLGLNPANAGTVFGPNLSGNMLVMCHELIERALLLFFLDFNINQVIADLFDQPTGEELKEARKLSAFIWELQVLFHELGHGMDFLLLKDTVNNAIKQQNFTIPLPNMCGQLGCDTIREDFADWISAHILIEVIKEQIKEDIDQAKIMAAAWLVALDAWDIVIMAAPDTVHGLTESRQINMLCYAYGAIPEFRQSDIDDLNSKLFLAISATGLDPVDCQTIYQMNSNSTDTLLSSYIN